MDWNAMFVFLAALVFWRSYFVSQALVDTCVCSVLQMPTPTCVHVCLLWRHRELPRVAGCSFAGPARLSVCSASLLILVSARATEGPCRLFHLRVQPGTLSDVTSCGRCSTVFLACHWCVVHVMFPFRFSPIMYFEMTYQHIEASNLSLLYCLYSPYFAWIAHNILVISGRCHLHSITIVSPATVHLQLVSDIY